MSALLAAAKSAFQRLSPRSSASASASTSTSAPAPANLDTLSFFTLNVLLDNDAARYAAILGVVRSFDVDVVALQEVTPFFWQVANQPRRCCR